MCGVFVISVYVPIQSTFNWYDSTKYYKYVVLSSHIFIWPQYLFVWRVSVCVCVIADDNTGPCGFDAPICLFTAEHSRTQSVSIVAALLFVHSLPCFLIRLVVFHSILYSLLFATIASSRSLLHNAQRRCAIAVVVNTLNHTSWATQQQYLLMYMAVLYILRNRHTHTDTHTFYLFTEIDKRSAFYLRILLDIDVYIRDSNYRISIYIHIYCICYMYVACHLPLIPSNSPHHMWLCMMLTRRVHHHALANERVSRTLDALCRCASLTLHTFVYS